jgi:predicted RNA-binding protein with RPS1 domain
MERSETPQAENAPLEIKRKMKFTGKVIHTTLGGAVVDIGLEKPGIVHISHLQEEPVNRVEDVVQVGQEVDVWVHRVDKKTGVIELTMIEPLKLEWREIKKGMKVSGKVTRIERFGVFVDIGAERPGLIHISELSHDYVRNPHQVVKIGDEIEAQVIEVKRRKKQIKLSRKPLLEKPSEGTTEKIEHLLEENDDNPVPTAMEIALREAMSKAKNHVNESTKSRHTGTPNGDELDEILTRTLDNYVSTQ